MFLSATKPRRLLIIAGVTTGVVMVPVLAVYLLDILWEERSKAREREEAAVTRGISYYQGRQYEKAIATFTENIGQNPDDVRNYYYRALAYQRLERLDESLADLERALAIKPADIGANLARASIMVDIQRFEEAISHCERILRDDPSHAGALNIRGTVHFKKGDFELALSDFSLALRADHLDAETYQNRADTYLALRNYENAIADFRQIAELQPNNATARIDLAWWLAVSPETKVRDGKAALVNARKACDLTERKNAEALAALAAAFAETGDFDEAIRWQKAALDLPNINDRFRAESLQRIQLYEKRMPYRAHFRP